MTCSDSDLIEVDVKKIHKTRLSEWATEIRNIRTNLRTRSAENAPRSRAHLDSIVAFNTGIFYTGLFFSFLDWSYVFPWVLMGLSISSTWTTVSHHVIHGGYHNNSHHHHHHHHHATNDSDNRYNRFKYGVTLRRRVLDWMDYILPEAWFCEHNIYHHYKLNESTDPDNVQQNLVLLRTLNVPRIVKYGIVVLFALTWRLLYYSPNSYKYQQARKLKREMKEDRGDYKQLTLVGLVLNEWPEWVSKAQYLATVMLPLVAYRAVCFAPVYLAHAYFPFIVTQLHVQNVVLNYILADILCNVHTFAIVIPNHAGTDMYLYTSSVLANSDEWLLRQCISSTNYTLGTDVVDYLHGWLNYQIEHHLFPDLSAYEYQLIHADVRATCEKYGIPYVCENVFIRLWKTAKIMSGQDSMPYYEGSDLEQYVKEQWNPN
jgi:fatty acid desaturase